MDVIRRFASRAAYYHDSRPDYPQAILTTLEKQLGLNPRYVIADIGSGTGLLGQLFLDYGCRVYGVEPNREMRKVAENMLAGRTNFTSVSGRAEATNLPDDSVDLVIAGQAFHWFDWPRALEEFLRILRPEGRAMMVWNVQNRESALVRAYQDVLHQFGQSYQEVAHTRQEIADALVNFYTPGDYRVTTFPHAQVFDWAGFKGRFLSTSTAPLPGDDDYEPALTALQAAFNAHAKNDQVHFLYTTHVHTGRLAQVNLG